MTTDESHPGWGGDERRSVMEDKLLVRRAREHDVAAVQIMLTRLLDATGPEFLALNRPPWAAATATAKKDRDIPCARPQWSPVELTCGQRVPSEGFLRHSGEARGDVHLHFLRPIWDAAR